jgi:exonuclease SbcC
MPAPPLMNKERTLNLIRDRFVNLTDSATDVVRAERRYNDAPMGVFYFDFSQTVATDSFDLRSYLQERIATDFYRHEGSLQWNYYLYFLLDNTALLRLRATPKAAQIEADRTFARKFLRDPEGLENELSHPLAGTLQSTPRAQDIASRWVEALRDAGLGRIADPTADYAPTIRDFLAGVTKKTAVASRFPIAPVSNGRFIRSLDLNCFRSHPTETRFTFGTVNLIRGVNGTGKTSLLEAIELCICGGNRRQRGERPSGARLYIQYQGQTQPLRCPEASATPYRTRDLAWYGGYYLQGNRLFDNFARFNFFDSDAGFQLSSATNGEAVVKAVTTLLLGEFANTLEQRMRQCKMRFEPEQRELQKLVQVRRKELAKANEELAQVRAIKDTREALTAELLAKSKDCGWKDAPKRPKLDELALLEEAVEDRTERLAQHTRRLTWIARISIATLRQEADQLAEAIKQIATIRVTIDKNKIATGKDRDRITVLEAELKTLSRLKQYHAESEAIMLIGSGDAIAAIRTNVARIREALGLLRGLNLRPFEQVTFPLPDLAVQQSLEISKRRRTLAKLKNRATELQTQLGTIKSVVEEIKGLGLRFCEVSPATKACPLCGTEHDDLRHRIAAMSVGPVLEVPLGELTAEIAREQSALDELQKNAGALAQIQQAAQIQFSASQLAARSTKSIIEALSAMSDRYLAEKAKLDVLTAREKRLKLAGFTETELRALYAESTKVHGFPQTRLDKANYVQSLLIDRKNALDGLLSAVKDKEKIQRELQAELLRVIAGRFGDNPVDDPDTELERRLTNVEEVLADSLDSKGQVKVTESDDLATIRDRLTAFAKAVRRIQEVFKRVEEKDALEKNLMANAGETQRELVSIEPRLNRATAALAILNKLLGSEYKAAYLDKVIADHKEKLAMIFSRIHAPHEFKDVHLDQNMLLERHTGTKSPVSEISTGQRSALALSIFLSLNSGVSTRAPWLIFDDPVAQVDDVNVLSFLDMLRDLVLLGHRQVFFATANSRFADLFARKFDFLGDEEFKEIRLQR